MEMTIQMALNQIGLLDSKIKKATSDAQFATVVAGSKSVIGFKTVEDYINRVKSNLQSVQDLTKRRREIKSAIIASNAHTVIKVAGRVITMASAIEEKGSKDRKGSLDYEKDLLSKLVRDFTMANNLLDKDIKALELEISQKADIMLGKDSIKADPSQIDDIRKLLIAQKEPKFIDPIGIQSVIDEMSNYIEEFESNIDALMNESNAVTRITISGPESNPQ